MWALGWVSVLAACHASGGFTQAQTAKALSAPQCQSAKVPTELDLMGASPSTRARLAEAKAQGPVVLHVERNGCSLAVEVLACTVEGAQLSRYRPFAASESRIARDADELVATLPVEASNLTKDLSSSPGIRLDYELVGVQHASDLGDTSFRLKGAGCDRATHVVTGIYYGGFKMVAGDADSLEKAPRIFGPGAASAGRTLRSEGDGNACAQAQRDGRENSACGSPLRITVQEIARSTGIVVVTPKPPPVPPKQPPPPIEVAEPDLPDDAEVATNDDPPAAMSKGTEFSGMLIRVIYPKRRESDAKRVSARVIAHGGKTFLYEVSDNGNSGYVGKFFIMSRFSNRASFIVSLLRDIEPLAPTVGDSYSYSDGQHVNLWIAK